MDEFKLFLKLLQVKPLRQALRKERFIPDPIPLGPYWQKHNPGITVRNVEMAIQHEHLKAKARK